MIHMLLNLMVSIEKIGSYLKRPECLITSDQLNVAKGALKDGDVVLSHTDWELSNIFISGKYKHSGVYYKGKIYEATTDNVRTRDVAEWFYKKDAVAILRCRLSFLNMDEGIKFMNQCLGEPYNYDFFALNTTKIWFCSEYVYKFLKIAVVGLSTRFFVKKRFGKRTVSPSDFYTDGHNFEVIVEL